MTDKEKILDIIKKLQDKAEKNSNEAFKKYEYSIEQYWDGFYDGLSAILRELQ
jgi:hypothetical protein